MERTERYERTYLPVDRSDLPAAMIRRFILAAAALPGLALWVPPASAASACVVSVPHGSCGPYAFSSVSPGRQRAIVVQDVWRPSSAYRSQVLTSYSAANWHATTNVAAGNMPVVSYPDTKQVMSSGSGAPSPVTSFAGISSSYAERLPAAGRFESAYDIWLSASGQVQEIMIWTYNHGQRPAGTDTRRTATIGTRAYEVWASTANKIVTLASRTSAVSGTTDILGSLRWLQHHGYTRASAGLTSIDYGFEICSTGGHPETFSLDSYSLVK